MASGNHSLFEIPSEFQTKLRNCMTVNDANRLSKALEEAVTTSWDLFGQFHLNLSPGTIENIREERGRSARVRLHY